MDVRYTPRTFKHTFPVKPDFTAYGVDTVPNLVGTKFYKLVDNFIGYTDFELYMFFPLDTATIHAYADTEDWKQDISTWFDGTDT